MPDGAAVAMNVVGGIGGCGACQIGSVRGGFAPGNKGGSGTIPCSWQTALGGNIEAWIAAA